MALVRKVWEICISCQEKRTKGKIKHKEQQQGEEEEEADECSGGRGHGFTMSGRPKHARWAYSAGSDAG